MNWDFTQRVLIAAKKGLYNYMDVTRKMGFIVLTLGQIYIEQANCFVCCCFLSIRQQG